MSNKRDLHTDAVPEMAPAFEKFLDDALPNNGGNHTLVLGENHSVTTHLHWLKTHLPTLRKHYGINTIGLEKPFYLNIFLWAYQDGTLDKALGSHAQAKSYLHAVLHAAADKAYREHDSIEADIVIEALDSGMRIALFDSRHYLKLGETGFLRRETAEECHDDLADVFTPGGLYTAQVQEQLRMDKNLHAMLGGCDAHSRTAWILTELDWLCHLKPEHRERYVALRNLVELGHRKIEMGKLTSDALSATLFDAMSLPSNRLTIGGLGHVNGMGDPCNSEHPFYTSDKVHGTFGRHLFAVGETTHPSQKHQVTHAFIAGTQDVSYVNWIAQGGYYVPRIPPLALKQHVVSVLNLETGAVGQIWQPPANDPQVVPLEEKFPQALPFPSTLQAHQAAHINPLLMSDIKAAADAVRVAVNGPEQGPAR